MNYKMMGRFYRPDSATEEQLNKCAQLRYDEVPLEEAI